MQNARAPWLATFAILVVTGGVMLATGRNAICPCGTVQLWSGVGEVAQNSQHLTDWYTPSHILHGLMFFALLWLVARRVPLGWRMVIATAIEAAWELLENSSWVIERYRAVTISLDYFGDSVLNSMVDIAAMIGGFWLARVLPVWVSVALVLGFEALTAWVIRDGLALNVLMLLWPMDAVLQWQSGG